MKKQPMDDELNALAIPWHSGEQPVKDDVLVYAKMRGKYWIRNKPAKDLRWGWKNGPSDILAYIPASTVDSYFSDAIDEQAERLRVRVLVNEPTDVELDAEKATNLTKRELFSAMMLHALLSSPSYQGDALDAVQWADLLIDELARDK